MWWKGVCLYSYVHAYTFFSLKLDLSSFYVAQDSLKFTAVLLL